MTEAEARASVVKEARSWIGTPYHHQAGIKGRGCDCGQLLRRVFVDTGVIPDFEVAPYAADQMFHRAEEFIFGIVTGCGANEVPEVTGPGDIVLWRHGHSFSHCGIVTDWPRVVHAFARERQVIESDTSRYPILSGKRHPRRFFSFWG